MVLSGHDHVFTRTKPVYDGKVTTEKYKGTVYIEGGSAGDKYYNIQSQENADKWAASAAQKTCATVITLGKEQFTTKTYDYSGNLLDSSYTPRKRFGEYDASYTKEQFEDSITVTNNNPDLTSGTISWSEKGYGHVKNITVTHLNSEEVLGATSFINTLNTSIKVKNKFWVGEINEFKVDIVYSDGTTSSVELELDNRVEWGKIHTIKATNITDRTFNLILVADINTEFEYLYSIRVLEDGALKKNFALKDVDLSEKEILIDIKNKLMEPNTKHTYTIQILNVNKTVIYEQELMIRSKPELTEEDEYKESMANVAFKVMIDNLLKALGAQAEE